MSKLSVCFIPPTSNAVVTQYTHRIRLYEICAIKETQLFKKKSCARFSGPVSLVQTLVAIPGWGISQTGRLSFLRLGC